MIYPLALSRATVQGLVVYHSADEAFIQAQAGSPGSCELPRRCNIPQRRRRPGPGSRSQARPGAPMIAEHDAPPPAFASPVRVPGCHDNARMPRPWLGAAEWGTRLAGPVGVPERTRPRASSALPVWRLHANIIQISRYLSASHTLQPRPMPAYVHVQRGGVIAASPTCPKAAQHVTHTAQGLALARNCGAHHRSGRI